MAMMDIIRCDLKTYLVWKWKPFSTDTNSKNIRQNAIRWGSSLRVKDGEMAVFVYNNKESGKNQDIIVGPFDEILKTSNLPVLANIIGLAYDGQSPFQAEIYFINLANIIQVDFNVEPFDIFDIRFEDRGLPTTAKGRLSFKISDYEQFIKTNRLIDFNLMDFRNQISSMVIRDIKQGVIDVMEEKQIPAAQIGNKLKIINDKISQDVEVDINKFGVSLVSFDLEKVELDKSSSAYADYIDLTHKEKAQAIKAQGAVNRTNLEQMQRINQENMEETLRVQREEMQHSQRMQTDSNFFNVHSVNQQADVMKAGAQALGQMGAAGGVNGASVGNMGMNPAGMMTGMMMGGALGGQMAGMMNTMGQQMNQNYQQAMQVPPPVPQVSYYLYVNGQQMGPYGLQQLQMLVGQGILAPETLVWKQGMSQWAAAKDTELVQLFGIQTPPPIPPVPPTL